MQIDKNTVINCNNLNEVKDCLDKLQELGFNVCFNNNKDQLVVNQSRDINSFQNYIWAKFYPENFCVNYNTFIKLYNKQIKEKKEPDLVVDKNGRILKVNNFNNSNIILHYKFGAFYMSRPLTELKISDLNNNYYYTSHEALKKALKRKEIENKLRTLAFELNGNKDIDWEDNKTKYFICYNTDYYFQNIFQSNIQHTKEQGVIYCYSENFKNKAIELIGQEDLKDYLING